MLLAVLPAFATASPAVALSAPGADPVVAALVAQVSPDRLRATDGRLVAFGTRNTFATDTSSTRGAVAARDWIAARFRQIARKEFGPHDGAGEPT